MKLNYKEKIDENTYKLPNNSFYECMVLRMIKLTI